MQCMSHHITDGNADGGYVQGSERLAKEHADEGETRERQESFHGDALDLDDSLLEEALDIVLRLLRLDAAKNHGRDQNGD